MLGKNELKTQGLQYLRKLQVAVRNAAIFSPDHQATAGPLQQSFEALNALLKETRRFTIGFADQRVIINNIYTMDRMLTQLEDEFAKRNIGAVTFEPGITLAAYKRLLGVLSVASTAIEQAGGIHTFLDRNRIEGVRVTPVDLLDTDSERSKGAGAGVSLGGLEMLLESAGQKMPERMVGGPEEIMRLITPTLESALANPQSDPQKACAGLARVLEDLQPDLVLSRFSAERREQVRNLPPHELAIELVEDTAARWAAQRLSTAPAGPEGIEVEEEVLGVLVRSLQATQMADRLAQKLAQYVKEFAIPKSSYDRIQNELKWVSLSPQRKQDSLLQQARYDSVQFRRLLEHLKELVAQSRMAEATELANHYFEVLDSPGTDVQPEELSRAAEVILVMAGLRSDFAARTAGRLAEALMRPYNQLAHFQVANCLAVLSKSVGTYEDFAVVQVVGSALERSVAREPARHVACCNVAFKNLLTPASVDRALELYIQKRDDSAWARTVSTFLRWIGTPAVEAAFRRLEEEQNTANRLGLLRLLAQAGRAGIGVARQRLNDQRWYVVRNAAQVLGALNDPDLLQHVAPALQHPDDRVQNAAAAIVIKSRLPQRGTCLAEALPHLRAQMLDDALHELMFLRDPATVPVLLRFLTTGPAAKKPLEKVAQAIATIPGEEALDALGVILGSAGLPLHVRRIALDALRRSQSDTSRRLLAALAADASNDPLADDLRKAAAGSSS